MSEPLPNFPPIPRVEPPPKISERELETAILQTAAVLGYMAHAERPAWSAKGYRTPIRGDKGWPDLVLLAPDGRMLLRELKVGRNVLSEEQIAWIERLRAGGHDVGVWTDVDWFAGVVEAELRRAPESEAA